MLPKALFDGVLKAAQSSLQVRDVDRPKIQAWFDRWLVTAATQTPGIWAEQFRPRLRSLAETIDLEFDTTRNRFKVTCGPADTDTLLYLTRGTMWFDGVDQLDSELVRVISSANPTIES